MSRLAISSLLAVAAFAVAGEARAGLRCDAMGTGELAPAAVAATPTPVAPAATPTPVRKPAAPAAAKPAPARAAEGRTGGTPTPDWRALIPGSLR
ncbi:MAG TPA: hypothetical protein VFL14_09605 [Xanthomonadales bacterium]|nr:hypothetical protein [Xanthomonadales bacterium]